MGATGIVHVVAENDRVEIEVRHVSQGFKMITGIPAGEGHGVGLDPVGLAATGGEFFLEDIAIAVGLIVDAVAPGERVSQDGDSGFLGIFFLAELFVSVAKAVEDDMAVGPTLSGLDLEDVIGLVELIAEIKFGGKSEVN